MCPMHRTGVSPDVLEWDMIKTQLLIQNNTCQGLFDPLLEHCFDTGEATRDTSRTFFRTFLRLLNPGGADLDRSLGKDWRRSLVKQAVLPACLVHVCALGIGNAACSMWMRLNGGGHVEARHSMPKLGKSAAKRRPTSDTAWRGLRRGGEPHWRG